MLAAQRTLSAQGRKIAETPLLVPSFSSKGFPQLSEIVRVCSEYITDCALVSAYDVHYKHLDEAPLGFPAFWILDSGGYEAGTLEELSELHYSAHKPEKWEPEFLTAVLDQWSPGVPTVAVSYDNPVRRISLEQQIEEALQLFDGRRLGREFLVKPETKDQSRIHASRIGSVVGKLGEFDVLGITEKELGYSLFDRVKRIAKIRRSLDAAGLQIPIHVFGTLDMVSTPLYFLAGADIFDGLTWLRFAYRDGLAIYMRDLAAVEPKHFGCRINDLEVRPRVLWSNLQEIWRLGHSMRMYLKTRKLDAFQYHASFFAKTLEEAGVEI